MLTHSPNIPRKIVLLASSRKEDHTSLEDIFRDSLWDLQGAWKGCEGLEIIRRSQGKVAVFIVEHILPDGDWRLLLAELDKMAVRPSFVVSSRVADERLWAEVLNWGAFDLLQGAPFEPEEVLRVTQSAWFAWKSAARPKPAGRAHRVMNAVAVRPI